MPKTETTVIYEAPSGALYPGVVKETDAENGLVFIRYFAVSIGQFMTGWRPLSSLSFN